MALNCVKAGVGCGACKRQNIDIPYPLSLTLEAELGGDQTLSGSGTSFRHTWPVGGCPRTSYRERRRPRRPITTGCEAFHGLAMGHLVLAPTPSPPSWASAQSRADRERRAGMPAEQCLSVLG